MAATERLDAHSDPLIAKEHRINLGHTLGSLHNLVLLWDILLGCLLQRYRHMQKGYTAYILLSSVGREGRFFAARCGAVPAWNRLARSSYGAEWLTITTGIGQYSQKIVSTVT